MNGEPVTAERARSILDDLIHQRQQMRAGAADDGLLEANRLGIVYWQLQLNRALGVSHQNSKAAA